MLIKGANSSWLDYDSYIHELFWRGYINLHDYLLPKETGQLHKDGKPYKNNTTMTHDENNDFNKNIWPKMTEHDRLKLLAIIVSGIRSGKVVLMNGELFSYYSDFIKEMIEKYK